MDIEKPYSMKSARGKFEYTQEEIAKKLGVSRVTYNTWEQNKVKPKRMVILALAEIYGIDPNMIKID